MKFTTTTLTTLLVAAAAIVNAASSNTTTTTGDGISGNKTTTVPEAEICILSIIPCPRRCRNTCIYPDLPCPMTHPPHCPNEKPQVWPPRQEMKDSISTKTLEISQEIHHEETAGFKATQEKISLYNDCNGLPCPRIIFKPCPKECPSTCEFRNPSNPCCPYSGSPVCK